jgi:hypothetical protein
VLFVQSRGENKTLYAGLFLCVPTRATSGLSQAVDFICVHKTDVQTGSKCPYLSDVAKYWYHLSPAADAGVKYA